MSSRTLRRIALFALVALHGALACQPRTAANVDFSCPRDCEQRTGYADRCGDLTKQAAWCNDLQASGTAGYKANPAGAQRLPCGCWTFAPALGGWKDPTCASGTARVEGCLMACMGGGIASSVVCS
jgi:hypothetical protein